MDIGWPASLGWISSLILLATILQQIHKQWQRGSSEGVSWFLFIGQAVASAGFVVYSWLSDDAVFMATNSVLLVSHFLGVWITWRQRA